MNAIETLTRILGLAFVSGINLYATVLAVGIGIRYQWVAGLPPELTVLSHPAVLTVAGVLYALEFLADKIPVVSTLWDLIHTFVRPIGGALLALAVVRGVRVDAPLEIIALLVGASIALGSHSTKMGVRFLAHAAPHPVLHAGLSLAEDAGVIGLLALVYAYPVAGLIVVACLIALTAFLGPLAFRVVCFAGRAALGRLMFWNVRPLPLPNWMPRSLVAPAGVPSPQAYVCFARSIPKVPKMKKGYLVDSSEGLYFVWKGLFTSKVRRLDAGLVSPPSRGWMVDVLTIADASGSKRTIYLTKDHAKRLYAGTPLNRTLHFSRSSA